MTIPKPPNSGARAGAPETSPERRAEIEEIFDEALDMPEEDRAAWLVSRCGDDVALRREVELLLAAHEQRDSPLDIPAAVHAASMFTDPARGRRIGPYRVLRELGRGGMGVVYLAERDDGQYRRRVAVKVLRASQDAGELHQRFLAERQILASLNHAHIAQLLDGGVSDGQLPYLVIEYVDGLPITEYCDRQRLDISARLRLFREVCSAVHHAHQNLVLHRDLKPGNVLVTGAGQVKLLDFGIAKLLNPTLAAVEQPVTRTAFRLMTPAYASPEQVRGDTLTTASDVYALGLLLYELLAGRPAHRITTNSPREVYEVVCERDAERPSDAIVSEDAGGASPAELAAGRGTSPERLRRQLRGDLDAIVAMALRKEAGRRYGSAELLAADVGRFLDGLPVFAHRGSRGYRFEKFVRRHRGAAMVAASSAVLLVVAAGVAFRSAAVATRERDRSTAALAQTQHALRESEAVTDLLVRLFQAGDPSEGGHVALTATDLLRRGVTAAEQLEGQPAAQARTFEALGRVYTVRGDLELGADLLQRALAIRRTKLAGDELSAATTTVALAEVLRLQGKYLAADTLARAALRVRRAALRDTHPDVAESLYQVAGIAVYLGNMADAEAHARDALEAWRRGGRGSDARMVAGLLRLSNIVWRRGDDAGAERLLREAMAVAERAYPGPHEDRAGVLMRLADLLGDHPERRIEAESLARAAVREIRAQSGDAHPTTANSIKQLGVRLAQYGKPAEAERLMREALVIQRRVWGDSNVVVGATMLALAEILTQRGNAVEAERLAQEAVVIHASSLGTNHSNYAGALGVLVDALVLRGAVDSAEVVARRAVDIRVASVGPTQTITALSVAGLAGVVARQGRFEEADSIYRSALAVIRRRTTESHVDMRRAYAGMAAMFEAWGKPDSAARYRRLAEPPRSGPR
jgi:serine/threonine protein kinase/tetratricopeptide (TPR) repeat protein